MLFTNTLPTYFPPLFRKLVELNYMTDQPTLLGGVPEMHPCGLSTIMFIEHINNLAILSAVNGPSRPIYAGRVLKNDSKTDTLIPVIFRRDAWPNGYVVYLFYLCKQRLQSQTKSSAISSAAQSRCLRRAALLGELISSGEA